jgi:hypothetical protein
LSLSKYESSEVFIKLFPGRLRCVSAGTLQSELQATGGEEKMKTERRNAATRQNVGSKEIKKIKTKQRKKIRLNKSGLSIQQKNRKMEIKTKQ